jgi:uncharacterized protein
MPITPLEFLGLALLGLVAGTLGGLLGVGGSLLVIPALLLLFAFAGQPIDLHLAFAAAMVMNAFLGAMSAYRHWRVGTMQPEVIRWLVPAAVAGVVVGVLWSNAFEDDWSKSLLKRCFGVFALYVAGYNFRQFLKGYRQYGEEPAEVAFDPAPDVEAVPSPLSTTLVGLPAGLLGGLLGIGGGGIAVPFQQLILHLPIKNAIGNSALVVFTSSLVGALLKLGTAKLPPDYGLAAPLWLATGLVPTAMLGAWWGSHLTHVLPPHWVVAPFVVVMLLMGGRMVIVG